MTTIERYHNWKRKRDLERARRRGKSICPKCESLKIRRCIDVSAHEEHLECVECGHSFPYTGPPVVIVFGHEDEEVD